MDYMLVQASSTAIRLFLWEANGRSVVSMNYEEFDSPMAYQ
jgi:hypothetical protein